MKGLMLIGVIGILYVGLIVMLFVLPQHERICDLTFRLDQFTLGVRHQQWLARTLLAAKY